jgi:hypothetical protein
VSHTKEAVYRDSGEADYDEAGSPPPRPAEKDEPEPNGKKTLASVPKRR